MKRIVPILSLVLALTGCSREQADGVYVEIDLKNDKNINSYILFNPNIKTIEECEASMEGALPSIMANLPAAVPKGSEATGWTCSLTDPKKTKRTET